MAAINHEFLYTLNGHEWCQCAHHHHCIYIERGEACDEEKHKPHGKCPNADCLNTTCNHPLCSRCSRNTTLTMFPCERGELDEQLRSLPDFNGSMSEIHIINWTDGEKYAFKTPKNKEFRGIPFYREAIMMTKLSAATVRYHGIYISNTGKEYLTMTLAKFDLAEFARRVALGKAKPLSKKAGLKLCILIYELLRSIHSLKVAHNDLKPDNLLLFDRGQGGVGPHPYRVKLADVGLAYEFELSDMPEAFKKFACSQRPQNPWLDPIFRTRLNSGDAVNTPSPSTDWYSWALICIMILSGGRHMHEMVEKAKNDATAFDRIESVTDVREQISKGKHVYGNVIGEILVDILKEGPENRRDYVDEAVQEMKAEMEKDVEKIEDDVVKIEDDVEKIEDDVEEIEEDVEKIVPYYREPSSRIRKRVESKFGTHEERVKVFKEYAAALIRFDFSALGNNVAYSDSHTWNGRAWDLALKYGAGGSKRAMGVVRDYMKKDDYKKLSSNSFWCKFKGEQGMN